ncbi:hypothetical protein [uncultured Faecalibaculum sp.]|uniref:hypothetical protein n=1 Tax=uncultured Faecalibaculum sp. TaxID=1729681 RepID=UPI00272E1F94|nr:hypothetical protein [uncultured Faecalibaculum sp.]
MAAVWVREISSLETCLKASDSFAEEGAFSAVLPLFFRTCRESRSASAGKQKMQKFTVIQLNERSTVDTIQTTVEQRFNQGEEQ